MPNVLVTGGAGYVGSHICKALSQQGYAPVVYDNLFRGHRSFVKWGPFIEADVTDQDALEDALRAHDIQAIIHCAALAYVGESWEIPLEYYRVNVLGAVSLFGAMQKTGVLRVVLSSSCTVYGEPDIVPMDESTPISPISPYGETKALVERMASDCAQAYDMTCIALRYFNAAGADPDGEVGEHHEPETHLIPNTLRAASDDDFTLSLFGTDYETEDGTAVRDYIHVCDLAAAHVAALEKDRISQPFSAFNLGTGQGTSVKQIIDVASRITERQVKFEPQARRPGDPPALVADAQLAQSVLDWQPKRSDIDTIISDAWAYAQTNTLK